MSDITCLPWHTGQYRHLPVLHRQNRMPHALLLSGPAGMGKGHFAGYLAAFLLCKDKRGDAPCGVCKSCRLRVAGTHPDLRHVQPEESRQIKIDQIRRLIADYTLTPQYDGYQITLIQPAENMNANAANSLLKLLEEPPPQALLILISHRPAVLLPTIRSRCRQIVFDGAQSDQTRAWLRQQLAGDPQADIDLLLDLSGQAPFAALELAKKLPQRRELFDDVEMLLKAKGDPIEIAAQWVKSGAHDVLVWMMAYTMDLIRARLSGDFIHNGDRREKLLDLSRRFESKPLFSLLEQQVHSLKLLQSQSNLREQGLLESLALTWLELGKQVG